MNQKAMKYFIKTSLILFAFLTLMCRSNAGNKQLSTSSKGTGEIVFREYEHDFGKVAEGEKLSYTFIFDNKGTSDIIMSSATASCGCTVPKYDSKPVPPGASGEIEVVFNTSGYKGRQTKTITVKSNASVPVVLLKITSEVESSDN